MIEWYYLAIGSGVLAASASLIEKHLLNKEHATSFTAVTTIVITIFTLFFLPSASFNLSLQQLALIYISATAFAGSSLLVARLYRHSNVSSTSPITSTLPIMFLTVLALLFLNESLSTTQYVGIVVLIAAIYMMLSDTRKGIPIQFLKKNVQYFIATGLLYAIGATILKFLLTDISPYTFLIVSEIFMSIDVLAFVFLRFKTLKYVIRDIRSYKVEVFVFSFASVGFGVLYYLAAVTESISIVFPLRSGVSIILTVFASGVLLHEKIAKRIPLAIIMVVAMYLIVG
ncbi:MAG: EamA family transporter [Candidatus Micrarchaeales archaeon]